jgi:N-acetylglucosaminyl-diphospho-decaprenol L-rhamnosyltransferase
MEQVDVVVVSYNSSEQLRGCVEPLVGVPSLNVMVVDSASSDASLERVSDLALDAVPLPENGGFGHGCNVGWRRGTAPYVLFLNPDARISPDAIARMAAAFHDRAVGAVAPRILESDGSLDYSLRRFPRLRSTYAQAFFLHRLFPQAEWSDELVREPVAYERRWRPDWASGACLLVRRDILERLEGFDEGFFLYCEDLDLCRRLHDAGFALLFEPGAEAIHEGGASMPRAGLLPVLAESRVHYARKHLRTGHAFLERAGIALGELLHTVISRGGLPARRGHARAFVRAVRA